MRSDNQLIKVLPDAYRLTFLNHCFIGFGLAAQLYRPDLSAWEVVKDIMDALEEDDYVHNNVYRVFKNNMNLVNDIKAFNNTPQHLRNSDDHIRMNKILNHPEFPKIIEGLEMLYGENQLINLIKSAANAKQTTTAKGSNP